MKEHNIRTREMEITPAYAERKLKELQHLVEQGVFRQRTINKPLVDSYASDMARGRWGLSHQGIAFDEQGRLIDGQHRLWAVIKAGIPVKMMVTTGLPGSTNGGFSVPTMDVIDRGKNRTVGNQLTIAHGISGAGYVAATVKAIANVYTADRHLRLTMTQVIELLEMYANGIHAIFSLTTHNRQKVGPILGPLVIYHASFPEKAKEFAQAFFTKENLRKGSPVLALIKWLDAHPHMGGRELVFQRIFAVCHCVHEFHHDKELEAAQSRDEAMYWLANLNKKHAEIIRKMIYPLRTT